MMFSVNSGICRHYGIETVACPSRAPDPTSTNQYQRRLLELAVRGELENEDGVPSSSGYRFRTIFWP